MGGDSIVPRSGHPSPRFLAYLRPWRKDAEGLRFDSGQYRFFAVFTVYLRFPQKWELELKWYKLFRIVLRLFFYIFSCVVYQMTK